MPAANNIMKTLICILITLSTLTCVSQQVSQYHTFPGTDNFITREIGFNVKRLEYPDYNVIIKANKSGGEKITIIYYKEQDTLISIQAGPIYFYGIYKNYLFLDEGTGIIRNLMIFDLTDHCFIYSSQYKNPLSLKSDSLFYAYPFPQTREIFDTFPKCPDSLKKFNQYGYSKERIFILKSRKSITTGKIKCEYRE